MTYVSPLNEERVHIKLYQTKRTNKTGRTYTITITMCNREYVRDLTMETDRVPNMTMCSKCLKAEWKAAAQKGEPNHAY